jgi:alpha-glucosidase (family GH31 glycosyl hydrolase)
MHAPLKGILRLLAAIACLTLLSTPPGRAQESGDSHSAEVYHPVANPRAMVILGNARFTVLTPQMIRMEWAADGKFEDRPSFVFLNRELPVPAFQSRVRHARGGRQLVLKTSDLTLTYVDSKSAQGKFTADDLHIDFLLNGKKVEWHPGMPDTGNLQGTTRTLDGALGSKTREPIGPGLLSRDGWTLIDDSTRPLFDSDDFSFPQGEKSPWPWVVERPAGDRQDWYFFGYGHAYKQALADFIKVAGPIPLPPLFAFGAWWSRYWAYSDQELDDLVRGFHENSTPLDVLVIDMDWHRTYGQRWWQHTLDQSGHTLGWSGYSWNKLLFPDPPDFLHHLHEEGLKVTLNLHPASGVQPFEDPYPAMARAMGIDPATKKYVPFDITNKKFATNYMDILHHPLEREGIDFWWLDWQQEADTRMANVNPTWWLNYVHFTDQEREGKRPLLFHRWGGLGNHRYQIGFSGDTISVWDSLAFQPWFTATAANVGYAYWSHDIGGHMPGVVDPELYTRWIQFGIFSPILRTHTTKNPDSERRIWAYPEPYSGIMRDAFQRRYAMIPYIYTEARRTYDTGEAFLHPLYYDWPEQDQAYSARNEYMFGDHLLAAPVVSPSDKASGLAKETVWLPPGDWIEWPTGSHLHGPLSIDRQFSIDQIPIYVRPGSILPMAPPMEWTGEKPVDPLILTVFPLASGATSDYTLYQDAGDTRAYEENQAAWTAIHAAQEGSDLTVTVAPVRGEYPGMPSSRAYELRLPMDWPPETVTANGQSLAYSEQSDRPGWRFEGNTLTTVITVPSGSVHSSTTVVIHRDPALMSRRAELDGFPGAITRLRQAYDAMNSAWPLGWSPDSLIDALQSGDRMHYAPQKAGDELRHFREVLPQAEAAVREAAQGPNPEEKAAIQHQVAQQQKNGTWRGQTAADRIAEYRTRVSRAVAAVSDISYPQP